jgi:hypothetical protein
MSVHAELPIIVWLFVLALAASDAAAQGGNDLRWYDARELAIEGKGWPDTADFYDRLPARAQGVVREPVWQLSKDSAGLSVRFVTDAASISARWTLRSNSLAMDHMPATGVSGLDLYVRMTGGIALWHWLAVGRPDKAPTNERSLISGLPPGRRECLLYLPLYNGVQSVEIGVPPNATLESAPPRPADRAKPICFYGTSITQGGCASRPGMAYPAILGRRLDRPVINLGLSGNAQMEPELAALLAELDPCAYVLDALPNMGSAMVQERVGPFVETLRRAHPDTPIVLVENIEYQNAAVVPGSREGYVARNAALREVYDRLVAAGTPNLTLVPAEGLLGDDGEATVDGTHATDLGFFRMADALEPVLSRILGR